MKNLGFLGYSNYAVTEDGKVFSIKAGRFLKSSLSSTSNRYRVNLYSGETVKTVEIHTPVAKAFIPNPNGYNIINHIDGNPQNNNVWNLEWCTAEYNVQHAVRTNLMNTRSISVEDAHSILKMMEEGYRNVDIADITGFSYAVIAKIRQGENYRPLWEMYSIPSKKHTVSLPTVIKIKEMLVNGLLVEQIAKTLKISRSLIKDIRDGIRFKHIELERATATPDEFREVGDKLMVSEAHGTK